MIYIIDDDEIMAECVVRACGERQTQIFSSAIEAMAALGEALDSKNATSVPKLIFLDILLDGPDGFTFLNEMVSYTDTARIPVVVVSSLDFSGKDLSVYGVVGVLDKAEMTPQEILSYAKKYA